MLGCGCLSVGEGHTLGRHNYGDVFTAETAEGAEMLRVNGLPENLGVLGVLCGNMSPHFRPGVLVGAPQPAETRAHAAGRMASIWASRNGVNSRKTYPGNLGLTSPSDQNL